ncbi:MAG: DUF3143 domain-containing protein [Gloeocapsa sp. DLM2.Bin57]|nr:MAG: DUF3143 domain-containing protein [Gloeocapsa sp. DLM2.Bin57]
MVLPSADTPLYNHPLFAIEKWLENMGCEQDSQELNRWTLTQLNWSVQIYLDIEEIVVQYSPTVNNPTEIKRAFKYSLTREDVEEAIFSGP